MKRKGYSVTISTVILSAIFIAATLIATYTAGYVIQMHSESIEFEQAKNTIILLATDIEDIVLKPKSAAYVIFNSRAGGPSFDKNIGEMTITIEGETNWILAQNLQINLMKYRGGSLVGLSNVEYLRGDESKPLIVVGVSEPLGYIYTERSSSAAWIVLDYSRIRVVYNGILSLFNVTTDSYENFNDVKIIYINIVPGEFHGSGRIYAKVENLGIIHQTNIFSSNPVPILKVSAFGRQETFSFSNLPNFDDSLKTIVTFLLIDISISML
jgi:hypothetical protein